MNDPLQQKIEQLKQELEVDFVSLALSSVNEVTKIREIRWNYVAGNTNQNYERIRLQVGKGIGGIVWRTGRGYQATNLQDMPEKLVELPITRMEKLETVVAYPVLKSGQVYGVLLAGYRTVRNVPDTLLQTIKIKANELNAYL
ncbi:GAF domain-containing protein [Enterococcus sp. LJL99]